MVLHSFLGPKCGGAQGLVREAQRDWGPLELFVHPLPQPQPVEGLLYLTECTLVQSPEALPREVDFPFISPPPPCPSSFPWGRNAVSRDKAPFVSSPGQVLELVVISPLLALVLVC
jgi:hypothetical protein